MNGKRTYTTPVVYTVIDKKAIKIKILFLSVSGVTMREKKGGALQKLKKRLSHSFGRLSKSFGNVFKKFWNAIPSLNYNNEN